VQPSGGTTQATEESESFDTHAASLQIEQSVTSRQSVGGMHGP
jgi:hypothetical protein